MQFFGSSVIDVSDLALAAGAISHIALSSTTKAKTTTKTV